MMDWKPLPATHDAAPGVGGIHVNGERFNLVA